MVGNGNLMGQWVNHCFHCRPSQALRDDLHSIVSSAPNDWEFEVITESASLSLIGMPSDEGSFVVGAYLPTDEPVLPMLYLAFMDDESYILSLKADHNCCASYGPPKEKRRPGLLNDLRNRIWECHPTFLNWKKTSSKGEQAVSAYRFKCEDQDKAEEQFMEAIDLIVEKGWTSALE